MRRFLALPFLAWSSKLNSEETLSLQSLFSQLRKVWKYPPWEVTPMLVFVNLIIEPEALEGKSGRLRSLRPVVIPPSQKLMR